MANPKITDEEVEKLKEYMPNDIKEKCKTYKGVPLPPPIDEE